MNLLATLVANPIKVAVGVLILALFGSLALMRMPMQLTPEVQTPTITIETRWPGASPVEVEREVVQEQEEQLKGIEGVRKMSSECMDSVGRVTLEFVVGTDMSAALLKVNSRLQQVREYPADADEPVITTANSSDRPIAWFILRPRVPTADEIEEFLVEHPDKRALAEPILRAHNSGLRLRRIEAAVAKDPEMAALRPPDLKIAEYRRFAEDFVEARFERVSGVTNANVLGGTEDELQVVVDPQRLAARSITIDRLRRALIGQNADTSAGDFWEGKRRYVVRTLGQFRSPEDVENVVVARRDGIPVYVRDVAEVRLGFKKPDGLVRNFGTTSIAINAVRETGANVLDVMEGLREANAELNAGVLRRRGLQLKQVYDETDYIYSSVGLVRRNIVWGGLLTIVVLLLFLKSGRSTLVVALAIPTSIIGTFLLLNLMGRSLNVVSLAGLAFAVGMLVDNAVVVLENIYRHYQEGATRFDAAVKGTAEVWGAVFASTLTTLAVFLPVVFVEEEAGQLFRDIALAISCSVGLSLLISVTLIPTLAMRVLPAEAKRDVPVPRWLSAVLSPLDRTAGAFRGFVVGVNRFVGGHIFRQIALVLVIVSLAVGTTWALFPKVEYLPTGDRNLVFGILLPPPGYNLDEMVSMGEQIEAGMQPYWDVDPGDAEAKALDFPPILDFFYVARGRQLFLGVRAQDGSRASELIPLIQRVGFTQPGTFAIAKQASLFEQGLSAGRTVEIEIAGPDLERLVQLGLRIFMEARQLIPDAQIIPQPSLDLSNPEVHVIPRWTEAADLGMTAVDLGYAVDSLVDGAYAGDYFRGGTRIDLTLVGRDEFAGSTQDLKDLPIATPSGALVPLSAVADVRLGSGPEQINRRERQRAITISVSPPPEMALEDAMEKITAGIIRPLENDGSLGDEYRLGLAGTADKLEATWTSLRFNVILALLITYLLMAALFESWIYPLVIITSVPLGAMGGFVGLKILNLFVYQPLDVLTMLGFVILIGTVVNNAILIVHQALQLVRAGRTRADAVVDAVRTRIRPIFMTLFTTVFGLLPLVVSPGAGSELYRGLGSVLLGGLLASTVFTLFVVPTLFRLTYRLQTLRTGQRKAALTQP
ncbi:MAG: efflux RND transporter permease subunit [Planctomycetota bacterium]|jgi:HAE1 family hydrophobic/amphiphilic exporter-1